MQDPDVLQPRYVSISTNAFTGALCLCILSVTAWFIYQLQYETSWARRFRIFGRWVRLNTKWIKRTMVISKKAISWMMANLQQIIKTSTNWFSHLHDEYKHKRPHLQRNIYWYLHLLIVRRFQLKVYFRAMGFNNRVAGINVKLQSEWGRDWPEPYVFSKFVRHVISLSKRCWIGLRNALSACFYRCHPQCQATEDIEVGESATQGETESQQNHSNPKTQAEEAKGLYCTSLRTIFEQEELVRLVSTRIGWWEDGE